MPGSFSKDAIGMFLQLDDQLSPALSRAETNYKHFTKALTAQNVIASKTASKGIGQLAAMMKSFATLPTAAVTGYKKAYQMLSRTVKPIRQPMELIFGTTKSKDAFANAVAGAVLKAMRQVTLRLSASMPIRRGRGFNPDGNMRAAYRHMVQPPDYMGKLNIPRFATGGSVAAKLTGKARTQKDPILAYLERDEYVLPGNAHRQLRKIADGATVPKALSAAFVNLQNMSSALRRTSLAAQGGNTGAQQLLPQVLKQAALDAKAFDNAMTNISKSLRTSINPAMINVRKDFMDTVKSTRQEVAQMTLWEKHLGGVKEDVEEIERSTSFLAKVKAIHVLATGGGIGGALGLGNSKELFDTVNELNRKFHLTRGELKGVRDYARETAVSLGTTLTDDDIGKAMAAVKDAGTSSVETMKTATAFVALAAKGYDVAEGDVADFATTFNEQLGLSSESIQNIFVDIDKVAKKTKTSTGQLLAQVRESVGDMGAQFAGLDAGAKQRVSVSVAQLGGQLSTAAGANASKGFTGLMGQAIGGNTQAMTTLMKMTGMQPTELMAALQSGNVGSIVAAMQQQLNSTGATAKGASSYQIESVRSAMGFSEAGFDPASFAMLLRNLDSTKTELGLVSRSLTQGTAGMQEMTSAVNDNSSAFTKDMVSIINFVHRAGQPLLDWFHSMGGFATVGALGSITQALNLLFPKTMKPLLKWTDKIGTALMKSLGWAFKGALGLLGTTIGGAALTVGALVLALASVGLLVRQMIVYWDDFKAGVMAVVNPIGAIMDAMAWIGAKSGAITPDEIAAASAHRGPHNVRHSPSTPILSAASLPATGATAPPGPDAADHHELLKAIHKTLKDIHRDGLAGGDNTGSSGHAAPATTPHRGISPASTNLARGTH